MARWGYRGKLGQGTVVGQDGLPMWKTRRQDSPGRRENASEHVAPDGPPDGHQSGVDDDMARERDVMVPPLVQHLDEKAEVALQEGERRHPSPARVIGYVLTVPPLVVPQDPERCWP